MRRRFVQWILPAVAAAVAGCAGERVRLSESDIESVRSVVERVPVDVTAGAGEGASLWEANLRSAPGMLATQASYELLQGQPQPVKNALPGERGWQGTLGAQRWSEEVSARLPSLLTDTPVEIGYRAQQQREIGAQGEAESRSEAASARWAPGPVSVALTAEPDQACMFNARLEGPGLARSSLWPDLSFSGRRCRRDTEGLADQVNVWTAAAGWNLGPGASQLQITRLQPQAAGLAQAAALELGAQQSLALRGWDLRGEVAWQSVAANAGAEPSGVEAPAVWASRTSLSRSLWRTPITAAWQRSQPAIWTVDSGAAAGDEASLALDFAPRLRRWLGPGTSANLSYSRWVPEGAEAGDDRLMMNMTFGW